MPRNSAWIQVTQVHNIAMKVLTPSAVGGKPNVALCQCVIEKCYACCGIWEVEMRWIPIKVEKKHQQCHRGKISLERYGRVLTRGELY